ncbi:MAG: hypothetical protein UZ09_BCD002002131 [Bacteroidetes bacterium OLB9]|nr:MAG: hypothetical protein UZ09_BCD002002131 [Bacteroidetes bacterium OLB9]
MKILITYKRSILLSGLIMLLFFLHADAQRRSNPFEIKQRLKAMHITDTLTLDPVVDTSLTATIKEPTADNKENQTVTNPFEVDHIPILRSSISKKSEKLKTETEGTQYSSRFLLWFLLLSCALLAIILNTRSKSLHLMSRSLFNENVLKLFQREESKGLGSYLLILYLNYFINISIIVYMLYIGSGLSGGIKVYLIIFAVIMALYLLKHFALYLYGYIFPVKKNTDMYNFTIMVFNHMMGIGLIPLNFLIVFAPADIANIALWIALIGILLLLALRSLRGLFIVSEYVSHRLFQIIVYLCAFEVAPLLILAKTIMNMS